MRKLPIAITIALMSLSAPAFAQEASVETTQSIEHTAKPSLLHIAMSEAAIMRCRAALKLRAEQEKYWPAVASALRALTRGPVTEDAVRRAAPAVSPLLATLDDRQRQVAMSFAQRAGLAQYASLF
jgi:predicted lipoprotein